MILFGSDTALVVLSAPNKAQPDVRYMSKIKWDNTGNFIKLNASNVLQGSFSQAVKLNSVKNDIEIFRLPSVSIERTDFTDGSKFEIELPKYKGKLMVCDKHEK